MAIAALTLIEAIRWRLNDQGGDMGPPSVGFYARWQEDDAGCLWKNRELIFYLNQVLQDLSRRKPIKDSGFREIRFISNVRLYPLDDDVLRVDSATRKSDGQPLVKLTVAELQSVTRWNRAERDMLNSNWRTATGLPTHYLTDELAGHLTVYPMPNAQNLDSLQLGVWGRYPAAPTWPSLQSESAPSRVLECVADDLDEALIAGVCSRAYMKNDADTYSPALVKKFEDQFTELVGPPVSQRQLTIESCWADAPGDIVPRTYFAY